MNRIKLGALVGVASLAISQPALAQKSPAQQAPSAEASDNPGGEIIVQARRRDENIQQVPISITALGSAALEARNITDAHSLGQNVPSLSVTTAGSAKSTLSVAIRGQRTGETQILTDPPVGVYFNEVNQPRTFGTTASFYDLQSIQVLKGVQGTLFGRNMTGGAVLIQSAEPSSKLGAAINASYGNYHHIDIDAIINLPLGDVAALRVAGRINRRDGYVIDQSNGRDYQDDHSNAFRVSLKLTPGPGFENITTFDYLETDEHGGGYVANFYKLSGPTGAYSLINAVYAGFSVDGGFTTYPGVSNPANPNRIPNNPGFGSFAGLAVFSPVSNLSAQVAAQNALNNSTNPYRIAGQTPGMGGKFDYPPVGGGVLPFERVVNWGITNKTTVKLGDNLQLKNVFGYRKAKLEFLADLDGLPAPLITAQQLKDIHEISNELQLSGNTADGKLDFVTGLYYFQESGFDGNVSSQFPELVTAFDPRPAAASANARLAGGQGSGTATSYAAYAAGTYAISDQVKFSAGLRYTIDERSIKDRPLRSDGLPSAANPTATTGYLNACAFNTTPVAGIPNPPLLADCSVNTSQTWRALTYDATIAYQPDDTTNLYLSFRHGFRAGAFSLRATNYVSLVAANPEKVDEFEFGAKKQFDLGSGARLTTNLALFYQNYSDVQKQIASTIGNVVGTQILNIAKEHIMGGELEATLYVGPVDISATYSYVDITTVQIAAAIANQYNDTGIPHSQASVNANWHLPVPKSFADVVLTGNWSYKSLNHLGSDTVSGTAADQPAYSLFDAKLSFNNIGGSGFSASAYITNIFNKFYRNGVVDIVSSTGIGTSSLGAPRMFGFKLGYKY